MKQATQTTGKYSRKEDTTQHKVRFSSINDVCETQQLDDIAYANDDTKDIVRRRYIKQVHDSDKTEQSKNVPYDVDSKLNVDHQHYEQWARAPIKRAVNTILLRGIQQLKAKAKREAFNDEHNAYMLLHSRHMPSRENNKDYASRVGSTRDIRGTSSQKDKFTKDIRVKDSYISDVSTKDTLYRDTIKDKTEARVSRVLLNFKTIENDMDGQVRVSETAHGHRQSLEESGFSRALSSIRHPTKPSDINIVIGKHDKDSKLYPDIQNSTESFLYRELPRSRYGLSRQSERSPFPVSIKQQKYHGEHVFVVSDPSKHRDFLKIKKDLSNRCSAKSENITTDASGILPKLELTDVRLPSDSSMLQEEMYRSKSFVASFPSKKQPRTLAQVPSVDFCDFSQLEENRLRQYSFITPPERPRTESAFSSKNINMLKFVPRVQRMKELLK